jgi:histidyl-tRNA synthetase
MLTVTDTLPFLEVPGSIDDSDRSVTSNLIEQTDFYLNCLNNFEHFLKKRKIKRTLKRLSQIIQNHIMDDQFDESLKDEDMHFNEFLEKILIKLNETALQLLKQGRTKQALACLQHTSHYLNNTSINYGNLLLNCQV